MKPELLTKIETIAASAFDACVDTDVTMWQIEPKVILECGQHLNLMPTEDKYNSSLVHYKLKIELLSKDKKSKATFQLHSHPF